MAEDKFVDTNQEISEYSGGCEINLKKKIGGAVLRDSLTTLIKTTLERENESQEIGRAHV